MADPVRPVDLPGWLHYIDRIHPREMALGLTRVREVAERLGVRQPAPTTVIVAGTNGKGSTCVALEHLLLQAGHSVGTTLSPHLNRFNERIRLNGVEADDAAICAAFETVEEARADVLLTYFEYAALAALLIFRRAAVDAAILEVGLGGRLDAFNVVDADLAVVTSIGLDHREYLGDDLESIGREKAGVFRPKRPVVLGRVSRSVHAAAADLDCPALSLERDFSIRESAHTWSYRCASLDLHVEGIPRGPLAPVNCALAVTAAALLDGPGRWNAASLSRVSLPGRFERFDLQGREVILDVAHNPAAADFLAHRLDRLSVHRDFVAIIGMLVDKDAKGVARALAGRVRAWLAVPVGGARGRPAESVVAELAGDGQPAATVSARRGMAEALQAALSLTVPGDGILVLGSFSAVEQARELLIDHPTAAC